MTGGFTSPTRGRARESSTSIVTAILVDEMTGAEPRPTNDLYNAFVLLDALQPGTLIRPRCRIMSFSFEYQRAAAKTERRAVAVVIGD
jgi:hypothetical protein